MNRFKLPARYILGCLRKRRSSEQKNFASYFSGNGLNLAKKSSKDALTRELHRIQYHLNRYFDIRKKSSSATVRDVEKKPWDLEPADPKHQYYTINIYYNTPTNKSVDATTQAKSLFSKTEKKDPEKKLRATIEQYLLNRMLHDKTFLESSLKKFLKNDLKNANPTKMNIIKDYIKNRHDDYLISALHKLQEIQQRKALQLVKEEFTEETVEEMETRNQQEQLEDQTTTKLAPKRIESTTETARSHNVTSTPPWFEMHHSPVQAAEEGSTKDEDITPPMEPTPTTNTNIKRPQWTSNFAESETNRPEMNKTKPKEMMWSDYDQSKINNQGDHSLSYKEEEFDEDAIAIDNEKEADVVPPRKVAMTDEEMAALFYTGVPETERKEMVGYPSGKYSKRKDILNKTTTIPQFDEQKRGLSDDEMAAIYHAYGAAQQLHIPGGITINKKKKLQLCGLGPAEEVTKKITPEFKAKQEEAYMQQLQHMLEQESSVTERILVEQKELEQEAQQQEAYQHEGQQQEKAYQQEAHRQEAYRQEAYRQEAYQQEGQQQEKVYQQEAHRQEAYRQEAYQQEGQQQEKVYQQEAHRQEAYRQEAYQQEAYRLEGHQQAYRQEAYRQEGHENEVYRREAHQKEAYQEKHKEEAYLDNKQIEPIEEQRSNLLPRDVMDVDEARAACEPIERHLKNAYPRKKQAVQEEVHPDAQVEPLEHQLRNTYPRRQQEVDTQAGIEPIEHTLREKYPRKPQQVHFSRTADCANLHERNEEQSANSEVLDVEIDDDIYMRVETAPKYILFKPGETKTEPATVSMEEGNGEECGDKLENVEMKDNHVVISTPKERKKVANAKCSRTPREEAAFAQYLVSLAQKGSPRKFSNETSSRPPDEESPASDVQRKVNDENQGNSEKISYIDNLRAISNRALARMNAALFPEGELEKKEEQLCLPPPKVVFKAGTATAVAKETGNIEESEKSTLSKS